MKNWKNPQEHKEKIDRYQPELYLQEKKEGIRAGNLWIIGLILLLLISLPRMVQMNRDAKARERETTALAISMQYDGAAQLEVLKGITASIQPDLSNPLTLSHITQQQANSYLYHLTPHEPDHDIYIAVPQVYEVLQFSLPREVPLVEGIRITLPDGRDWFVIQSVEYDAVREHTVSITLSPLLDAVPPPMTLVAGEFQTTITPKTNLNIVDREQTAVEWGTYTFQIPDEIRGQDGRLPAGTYLAIDQARVQVEPSKLSFSAMGHQIHVVD